MNDKIDLSQVRNTFEKSFGKSYQVIKSPGRINIIGEHVDYHEGFVMPAAIDKAVYFAFQKSNDKNCHYIALNLADEYKTSISNGRIPSALTWQLYVDAIMFILLDKGYEIGPINCVFGGDVPVGSGMSSSAAITCGLMAMWNEAFQLNLTKQQCILLAQEAEHKYVGVLCGIMDQFANTFGASKSIIKLDCRDLDYELIPFDYSDYCFLLVNTGVKHTHAGGEYNRIRKQCEDTLPLFKAEEFTVKSLRDVNQTMLDSISNEIDANTYAKVKFVIEELERVEFATACLANENIEGLGQLMYQTHFGLQNDYGVSSEELDFLVEQTLHMDEVLGARMMGGGFGGCTINLVPFSDAFEIGKEIQSVYKKTYPHKTDAYIARISEGTNIVK